MTFDYDALDHLTQITYPDGTTQQWIYDKLKPILHRDRLGRVTRFHYNALKQLAAIQDASGKTTNVEWNNNTLQSVTDSLGRTTQWKYNAQGQLIEKLYPDNSAISYEYYTNVNWLKTRTDAMGQKTHYTYYPDGTLQSISYSNTKNPTPSVTFNYNTTYKRLTSMADGTGTTTYGYNPSDIPTLGAGQLNEVNGPLNADVIRYDYDELGRLKERKINNVPTSYTYDELNRLKTINCPIGTFTNIYWNNINRLKQVDYPNGQKTVLDFYGIKQDQHLKQIRNISSSGDLLSQFDYQYDINRTITQWTQQLDNSPTTVIDLDYDKLNQLLAATYRQNGQVTKEFGYHYDKAGNRLSEKIDDNVTQASYNNLNQLINRQAGGAVLFKGNLNESGEVKVANQSALITEGTNFFQTASLQVGTNVVSIVATDENNNTKTNLYQIVTNPNEEETFEYDLNGNLISKTSPNSTVKYDWDGADRLIRITRQLSLSTNVSEFTYDGLSRRVRIVEKENDSLIRDNRFIWEDKAIIEER
ncbi:MAG: hypothetical protein R3F23_08585, partial [Verrucomicrobiia bacterium]